MLVWEVVKTSDDSDYDAITGTLYSGVHRAKIPGGWLVKMEQGKALTSAFVPDPQHKWDGRSLP